MNDTNEMKAFVQALPKAEIHVHLEGAIAPATMLKLAERHKMTDQLPSTEIEELRKWFTFTGFPNFAKIYLTIQDMIRTPEDFALVAYELGADMAKQNILYREATITPHTHVDYLKKGLSIEDVLGGLEEGRQKVKKDFGVEIRWVFDIYRNLAFMMNEDGSYNPEPAEKTLEYVIAGKDYGVVGIGIGGDEKGAPPEPFQHAFVAAKQAGFLSVPHAGETMGPESIWGSVRELQADRIGHGVRAIEDPELMDYLKEHHITLEVNPTSNICLHVYESMAEHPFKKLADYGIPVTINTDDPPLFNTTLSEEYALVAESFGYSKSEIAGFARNAFLAVGADLETKQKMLETFDTAVENLV